jgi:hypothetical protein
MWRIKIVEGKDRPKKANGNWAPLLSKYERVGHLKTINLLLDMMEPIHRTRKVYTGDSGFCVAMGVMALQKFGVHGQFLIKKRKYWLERVPGNYIDGYMATKPLGHTEMFVQVMEGQLTKIMSMHGVLDKIQDHATWRLLKKNCKGSLQRDGTGNCEL